MKPKIDSGFLSFFLVASMLMMNVAPALALGENLLATPTPNLSTPVPTPMPTPALATPTLVPTATPNLSTLTPTPLPTISVGPTPTPISTPIPTPELTPTPLPSILPSDITPPVISDVLEASLLPTEATIVWATGELAVSTLEYGTTTGYGSQATLPVTALLVHPAVILNLFPPKTYYYCIHATDLFGNIANSCGHSFTTAATANVLDATPPTVSLVSVTNVGTTLATINWTTDEVANAQVEYGTTRSYGSVSSFDKGLAINHSITLSGLSPNTEYHYRIRSSDESGNLTLSSDNIFNTSTLPQSGGQSIGSVSTSSVLVSSIEISPIATTSATITWNTDLPSDSQVEYGNSENLGSVVTLDSNLTTTHSITLQNLSPNTNYIFRVKSKPVGASVATISVNYEFNTLNQPVPVIVPANLASVSASSIGSSAATVTWNTDKPTTSQVQYGISTIYGQSTVNDSSLVSAHTVRLTDLTASTPYHYRVKSVDSDSNITFSEDYTFTTLVVANTGTGSSPASTGVVIVSTTPVPTSTTTPAPTISPSSTLAPTITFTPTVSPTSTPAPAVIAPPSALTSLIVASHDLKSVTLSWNAASASYDIAQEYDIRYSQFVITDSNFKDATPAQTTPIFYADLQPSGSQRTYIVPGLIIDTPYFFALKSKYEKSDNSAISNNVTIKIEAERGNSLKVGSSANSGRGGGGSGGASYSQIFAPLLINATPDDGQVALAWKNPNQSSFVRTVLVRKVDGYPTSAQDGQAIYEGDSQTFTDTNLKNDQTYYYSLYSYDYSKNYSQGVPISLAPKAKNKEVIIYMTPQVVQTGPIEHFVRNLKKGDKDIEVEHLQEILSVDEGLYPEKSITGYFSAQTESALKHFQQKYHLPQTGITDLATQAKLNKVSQSSVKLEAPKDIANTFNRDLPRGSQGDEVAALQRFLIYEGSYTGTVVDGKYGVSTVNAVKIFQKKYGVKPASGYFGPKTRHKIRDITGL